MGRGSLVLGIVGFGLISMLGTAVGLFGMITIVLFLPGLVLIVIVNIPLAWWLWRYNNKRTEADWSNVQKPWYDSDEESTDVTPW